MPEKDESPPVSLEDAVYTAVGLAILGWQQLAVARRDVHRQLRDLLGVPQPGDRPHSSG